MNISQEAIDALRTHMQGVQVYTGPIKNDYSELVWKQELYCMVVEDPNSWTGFRSIEVGNCPACYRVCPLTHFCRDGHEAKYSKTYEFALDGEGYYINPGFISYALTLPQEGQTTIKSQSNYRFIGAMEPQGWVDPELKSSDTIRAQRIGKVNIVLRDLYWTGGLSDEGIEELRQLKADPQVRTILNEYN